jgi:hypothetical protein
LPDSTPSNLPIIDWRILIDVNTHGGVNRLFREAGAHVETAWAAVHETAPDENIDDYAQRNGCIIVSHDRRFMRLIQQRLYQRDIPASTGYGRILLCGGERQQPIRLREVLPLLVLYHSWAIATNRRFLAVVGDNWVRFDDKPIARVIRDEPATR